ncbi:MAG: N-formylglutamate amidohydrolase [Ruegeria sp.]
MNHLESPSNDPVFGPVVHVSKADGTPSVLVACEHASNRIPEVLGDMGLSREALKSHIAWDPGALTVAQAISHHMSATLIYGGVSRLVYDCNRPPEAADAMPASSEDIPIPANAGLTASQRAARVERIYLPFAASVSDEITQNRASLKLMVTVHSFTPVYRGQSRAVEIGLLHGEDDRFARAMMATVPDAAPWVVRLNQPYSAADGVAHTLDVQAAPSGLLNVMIEIRNDLIQTPEQQQKMADDLAPWIMRTLTKLDERNVA